MAERIHRAREESPDFNGRGVRERRASKPQDLGFQPKEKASATEAELQIKRLLSSKNSFQNLQGQIRLYLALLGIK